MASFERRRRLTSRTIANEMLLLLSTRWEKTSRCSSNTVTGVSVVTVAALGALCRMAISPKKSPGPSFFR